MAASVAPQVEDTLRVLAVVLHASGRAEGTRGGVRGEELPEVRCPRGAPEPPGVPAAAGAGRGGVRVRQCWPTLHPLRRVRLRADSASHHLIIIVITVIVIVKGYESRGSILLLLPRVDSESTAERSSAAAPGIRREVGVVNRGAG